MKTNSKPTKPITKIALYTFLFLTLGATTYLSKTVLELEQKGVKTTGKLLILGTGALMLLGLVIFLPRLEKKNNRQ